MSDGAAGQGTPRGRSLLLRLCDRLGMDGLKSKAEEADELRFRAERLAEMNAVLPSLVAGSDEIEKKVRTIHRRLNYGKKYRNWHRLMRILRPEGYKAGSYRVMPQRGADYVAPPASQVPDLMRAFGRRLDELASEPLDDTRARLVCAWALVMMIRIHPFADGNGRTTRTLINLLLLQAGHRPIDFPSDSTIYKRSPVWEGFKGHMRIVRDELGWSLRYGNVPPADYFDRLRGMLDREIEDVSTTTLSQRPDLVSIAEALDTVRRLGFESHRSEVS